MKKSEFLIELEKNLMGLPKRDRDERLSFYSEMIDDYIEDGKSEEEAVAELGGVETVVNQIAETTPLVRLVKEKIKPKRELHAWEVVLIILGFPLWFPLVIVGLTLLLVLYILIWVLVIVAYSVELSFIASGIGGVACFFALLFTGTFNIGYLGLALMGCGLAILFFYACKYITKLTIKLSGKIGTGIKRKIIGRGKEND